MRSRPDYRGRVALLAGWLFADLLAMLFVIELSTVQGKPVAAATPSASASASPSPSPSPSSHPIGLDPHFVKISITGVNYAGLQSQGINGSVGQGIVNQVTSKIRAEPGGSRPVGFVVTFANGPETPSGIATANTVANLVDKTLVAHQLQFAGCQGETGWQTAASQGTISLKIFFDNT